MDLSVDPLKKEEVQEGEVVLGTLTDEEPKRLYCLLEQMRQQCMDLAEKGERARGNEDLQESKAALLEKAENLLAEMDFVKKMLWFQIRQQFPSPDGYTGRGLRQGWQVVAIKEESYLGGMIIASMIEI